MNNTFTSKVQDILDLERTIREQGLSISELEHKQYDMELRQASLMQRIAELENKINKPII